MFCLCILNLHIDLYLMLGAQTVVDHHIVKSPGQSLAKAIGIAVQRRHTQCVAECEESGILYRRKSPAYVCIIIYIPTHKCIKTYQSLHIFPGSDQVPVDVVDDPF